MTSRFSQPGAAPAALIASFRDRYRAGLAADLASLMAADPMDGRAVIQIVAHRQAGQAGTFGAEAVGLAATALDRALMDGEAVDSALLRQLLDAMAEELARS